ncbi:MAG: hypothetical protein K0R94_1496 [Burkholderiales bacterium]|jgi:hypothetical protein|nr:hypothetical protein [Burkholderiales bacterium]
MVKYDENYLISTKVGRYEVKGKIFINKNHLPKFCPEKK